MFTTTEITEIRTTAEKVATAAALVQRIQEAIEFVESGDRCSETVVRNLHENLLDAEIELSKLIAVAL